MRFIAALLFFFCTTPLLWAQWTITGREALPAPDGVQFSRIKVSDGGSGTTELHIVSFNEKTHTLKVIDDADGAASLASAADQQGALAGVNGGYFHPDRKPLGLVVSDGQTLHNLERAKLLSGIVAASSKGISLRRIGEFKMSPIIKNALQAGPFLVDGGKEVKGLNATRVAARTVVCIGGAGRVALVICRSATLADTAQILLTPGLLPENGKISRALNLDGGTSTGLWVRGNGEPFYSREFKDVRNYLLVVKK